MFGVILSETKDLVFECGSQDEILHFVQDDSLWGNRRSDSVRRRPEDAIGRQFNIESLPAIAAVAANH